MSIIPRRRLSDRTTKYNLNDRKSKANVATCYNRANKTNRNDDNSNINISRNVYASGLKKNDNAVFSHLTSIGNLSNRIGEELG